MPIKLEAVLDTNVLYAAVRSQHGASNYLLRQAFTGRLTLHLTVPLVLEYEEVLIRERRDLGRTHGDIVQLLATILDVAERHRVYYLWRSHVGDPEDAHVLEAATAATCGNLVTFNTRDFTDAGLLNIRVVRPETFLEQNF